MRESSAKSLMVDVTDDGKSLMKIKKRSGCMKAPWRTPDVTVVDEMVLIVYVL